MSRRKQSNPKPSKREIEDSKRTEVGDNSFPADHIYLRKFGSETLVLAKKHLCSGTVLGTFRGILKEEDEVEQDKTLLKVSRCNGGSPVHVMLENEGRWLKLMRNAIVPTDANICLRISGGEILCTVTKDVNKEVELKVTCRIVDQQAKEDLVVDDTSEAEAGSEGMLNFDSEQTCALIEEMPSDKERKREIRTPPIRKNENDSTCDSDGRNDNGHSSRRESPNGTKVNERIKPHVLEENNSRQQKVSVPPDRKHSVEENGIYKCPLCNFFVEDRRIFEKHLQSHRSSSFKRASSHMTNAQSFCNACNIQFMSIDTYNVHKKFYCKSRHDKEDPSYSPSASEHSSLTIPGAFKPSPDTVILRNGTLNGAMAAPSLIQPQAIYAAISTNPLILLPCSIVSGESLVAQNGMVASPGTGIVLQTGTSYPAIVGKHPSVTKKEDNAPNRKTSHPAMNFSSGSPEVVAENSIPLRKRKMSEGDVLNLKKPLKLLNSDEIAKTSPSDPDAPLDLSFKRRKVSDVSYKRPLEKRHVENMDCSSISSEESCPSPRSAGFPSSGITKSPSSAYSNDSNHCYSGHEAVSPSKQPHIERVSPSPPLIRAEDTSTVLPPGMPPPKVLKQGNNVCEECNIVFYKYDNYLAHKKHYCAYRRQQLSALAAAAAAAAASSGNGPDHSSDDNNSNQSVVHESTHAYSTDENSKPVLRKMDNGESYRVVVNKPAHSAFVCDACGVKFSTLDTLNAHQTFYCSKREDSVMSKYVKSRRENSGSPDSLEPPFVGPEEWKCNYCETSCSSYETIRRHLLTHSELRGFRCLLCGYKGNTLRGMRAHACEHLSKSTSSIEEFMASTVISENDALPVSRHGAEFSDEESSHHQKSKSESDFSERSLDADPARARSAESSSADKKTSSEAHESSSVKIETRDGTPERLTESVNPLAFCDVVIKTENEHTSSGDESRDRHAEIRVIKSEPEPDSDCDTSSRAHSESPPVQPISVIRCGPDKNRRENNKFQNAIMSPGKDSDDSEMKYCNECDIAFVHVANFVAHKKYYCSHPVTNCIQEAATVQ